MQRSFISNNITKGTFPMFDMMLKMQRPGIRAMTMYHPMGLRTVLAEVNQPSRGR